MSDTFIKLSKFNELSPYKLKSKFKYIVGQPQLKRGVYVQSNKSLLDAVNKFFKKDSYLFACPLFYIENDTL